MGNGLRLDDVDDDDRNRYLSSNSIFLFSGSRCSHDRSVGFLDSVGGHDIASDRFIRRGLVHFGRRRRFRVRAIARKEETQNNGLRRPRERRRGGGRTTNDKKEEDDDNDHGRRRRSFDLVSRIIALARFVVVVLAILSLVVVGRFALGRIAQGTVGPRDDIGDGEAETTEREKEEENDDDDDDVGRRGDRGCERTVDGRETAPAEDNASRERAAENSRGDQARDASRQTKDQVSELARLYFKKKKFICYFFVSNSILSFVLIVFLLRRNELKALREIRRMQTTTELAIPRAPFARAARDTTASLAAGNSRAGGIPQRYRSDALDALQEAAEAHLVRQFEKANLLAIHAGRVTVMPKDLKLVARLDSM